MTDFKELEFKILTSIERKVCRGRNGENDALIFTTRCGRVFAMYHENNCCEHVSIEDICGDLEDLINVPIFLAEKVSNQNGTEYGSETWTFYKITSAYGSVTIRWYGSSNGYYSEEVSFKETNAEDVKHEYH